MRDDAGTGSEALPPSDAPALTAPTPHRWQRWMGPLASGLIAAALAVLVLGPWPLGGPVSGHGDALQHLALARATDAWGTPGVDRALAAPWGLDWSAFPTGTERLPLLVLRWLDALTGDAAVTLDLFAVLGIAATAAVACAVLGRLGLRPLLAGAVAVTFACSPFATARLASGHLFLFALYPVPLLVGLAVWSTSPTAAVPAGGAATTRRVSGLLRRWSLPAAAAAVVALSSAYWAAFTVLVLVGVGALVAVVAGSPRAAARRLAAPLALAAVVVAVAAASSLPQLVARADGRLGPAVDAVARPVADADAYGLRLGAAVAPRGDHPLPPLAAWGRRATLTDGPAEPGGTLGLAAVLGLGGLAVLVLRRAARPATPPRDGDGVLVRLAAVAAVAAGLGASGAGGFLLATVGFTQVRVWSRLVAVLAFVGLAALALLVQRWQRGATTGGPGAVRRLWPAVVVAVTALVLADAGMATGGGPATAATWRDDAELVRSLLHALPDGAAVAQLPVVSFPDHRGAERALGPALADRSGQLRFSAGAFRGSASDWQRTLAQWPAGQQVEALAAAGFDAVALQRSHRLVGPGDEAALAAAAGPAAGRTPGGTWVWFDLRPVRRALESRLGPSAVAALGAAATRPVGVAVEGGAGIEATGDEDDHLVGERSTVVLHRFDDDVTPVVLRARVQAAPGASVTVGDTTVRPGRDGVDVEVPVDLGARTARVPVVVDGAPLGGTPPGAGDVRARLSGVEVLDPRRP